MNPSTNGVRGRGLLLPATIPWTPGSLILTVCFVAVADMQFLASLILVLSGLQVMPDAESLIVGESFSFNISSVKTDNGRCGVVGPLFT